MHKTFYELSQKYGKIFRVSLLRKAFLGDEYGDNFAGRPRSFISKYFMFETGIVLGRANKVTYALRKILHRGFKAFGEGVARFELQVSEKLDRLVMELNIQIGKDLDV